MRAIVICQLWNGADHGKALTKTKNADPELETLLNMLEVSSEEWVGKCLRIVLLAVHCVGTRSE